MCNSAAYFNRIGFEGIASPNLETLTALHQLHTSEIVFENIDVLSGLGISTDIDDITRKLVANRRGGYCFEQNGLFMEVLRTIGFPVQPLMARSVWQLASDAPAGPKTHMVLKVMIDNEPWLADVGFGGIVLPQPIRFTQDGSQSTCHESFRLTDHEDGQQLQVQLGDHWAPMYNISHERQFPIDFQVANWFTSTNPGSKFRHSLIMARVTAEGRYALLNNRLTVRTRGQQPVQRFLNVDELLDVLSNEFALETDDHWRTLLQPFCQQMS